MRYGSQTALILIAGYLWYFLLPNKIITIMNEVKTSQLDMNQKIFEQAKPYTMFLENKTEGWRGTGFQIMSPSGNVYIITNRHVCGSKAQVLQATPDPEIPGIPRRILAKDWNNDLCLLEAMPQNKKGLKISKGYSLMEPAYAVGYPGDMPLSIVSGNILGEGFAIEEVEMERCEKALVSDITSGNNNRFKVLTELNLKTQKIESSCNYKIKTLATSLPIYPGDSGSMLINKNLEVLGVIWGTSKDDTHWGVAVPKDDVILFLQLF